MDRRQADRPQRTGTSGHIDRFESIDRSGIDVDLNDPVLRYGAADLIAEGYELSDLFEAASQRIERLLLDLRAYIPPGDYEAGETGRAQRVTEPTGETGQQVVGNGYHVRVHVLNTDLNGRYGLLKALPLKKKRQKVLQRLYPHISKLSIGKKEAANVKASPEACALSMVAMLTPNKASRVVGSDNRVSLFPDLPLEDLVRYIEVFKAMKASGPGLSWKATGYGPRLNERDGNFPKAPPTWAFSNLGLCTAIAAWSEEAQYEHDTRPLIKKLAESRVYVLGESDALPTSYTKAPHVAGIAAELYRLIQHTWKVTSGWHENEKDVYHLTLKRWLLYFDWSSWQDFLRTRTQYPPEYTSTIDHFLMQRIDPDIVQSAKAAGQHINSQCFHAADGKTKDKKRENKPKLLASFESLIEDGKDHGDLISRVVTQVGRLTGRDFPPEAERFFDAVLTREVENLKVAKDMLRAYMRLQGKRQDSSGASSSDEDGSSDATAAGGQTMASDLEVPE